MSHRVHALCALALVACIEQAPQHRRTHDAGPAQVARAVRFVPAATGDAAAAVRAEIERASTEHRQVLVYVGATWCEPCQYFHRAVEARLLDRDFPTLTFVEFDMDRDADRLRAAGYAPRMIPLFAVPAADGRASGRHMEGSIHGPGSVDEITPRLRALLSAA